MLDLGVNCPPSQWVPGFFPGGNRAWNEINHLSLLLPRLGMGGSIHLLPNTSYFSMILLLKCKWKCKNTYNSTLCIKCTRGD